ncbi:MAG: class I SAM-dependent methyltransferase [Candidatus Binatia bacterium]
MVPEEPQELTTLRQKYRWTSWVYDVLDYPWERRYRKWRTGVLGDLWGDVLELGVGTGRNLEFYPRGVRVTAVDLSSHMLARARRRAARASCTVHLLQGNATHLRQLPDCSFDWVVSTFMCCVMPDSLQPQAISEIARVLRPGGRFRLIEMIYSRIPGLRRRQERFAPFVERVYGARFDRHTLQFVEACPRLRVANTTFLKADTYLLIEGVRRDN